jgi:type IV pilus assembly protein PilX
MTCTQAAQARQTGSAMVISLIFLLLMTLIGTSAMQSSTMQERMAGNTRDWNLAFQAAEAGLREAEQYLLDTAVLPSFSNANGFYQVNAANRPVWTGAAPNDGNGAIDYPSALPYTADLPKYFFEELSTVTPAGTETETGTPLEEISYFRVTAVGYGGARAPDGVTPVTAVVLSTVYRSR